METNNELEPQIKKLNNRCEAQNCNRKLKLTDFACRCQKRFCIIHIFSQEHGCSFDYKKHGIDLLTSQLIKCSADKMIKI